VIATRGERGLGHVGMRERLDAVRGTLLITSAPGQGAELLMSIPLEG
jgi:signal transduction histidine kinase